ncbi:MAG: tetratricopeptide repeat protein [Bacteroidales bacterium]|nr:tetratricopeptide repeat protein [Bacteroidales bacterium]
MLEVILVLFPIVVLNSCSSKKNTALTRQYKAFTTRYNVYFNGSEAYKEALNNMENNYQDNYSEMLYIHPVSSFANKEKVVPNSGFDRAIEKSQKAIKLRSISKRPIRDPRKSMSADYKNFLKRDEYNPFIHNAWMLMGKSQFFKGDFINSSATFLYITRHFSWLPQTVTESYIWMARCYCELGWLYEAENTLSKIDTKSITKEIKPLFEQTKTLYYIKKGDFSNAVPELESAVSLSEKGVQKQRMMFLLAQLYTQINEPDKAYKCYNKIIKSNPTYRTFFNASIAQTEVMPESQMKNIQAKLNKMLKDPRNEEYLDQVYCAIGNMYLKQKDTLNAVSSYSVAVEKSKNSGMEKAVAGIKLGDLSFAKEKYSLAQKGYAVAAGLLPKEHKDYKRVDNLSSILDKLKTYSEAVELQDSLLNLSTLSDDERRKIADDIVKNVIALEEKENKEKEIAARNEQTQNDANQNFSINPLNINTQANNGVIKQNIAVSNDNSWYFYNKSLVEAGKNDFQKKWGNRKLEDNWRRKNKTNIAVNTESEVHNGPQNEDENLDASIQNDSINENDTKNPDFYLSQIPLTEEAKQKCNDIICDALYNMGMIFYQELENLPLAIKTFSQLDSRYPINKYKADVYYDIYLMYMRLNDIANAEIYRNYIISGFPESNYSNALSNPDYIKNMKEMSEKQENLYEATYEAYLSGNTDVVHKNAEYVNQNWPMSKLMPKFMFLDAMAYASDKNNEMFKDILQKITVAYAKDAVSPLAQSMVDNINSGRTLSQGNNSRMSMVWQTEVINYKLDSGKVVNINTFKIEQNKPHVLLLAFQSDSVNVNQLLFNIAKYNFTNYLIQDFDLETLTFKDLTLLVIKGFENFDKLSDYRFRISMIGGLELPSAVTPVMISEDNFRVLLQGKSFDDYFSFLEQSSQESLEENDDSNDDNNNDNN